MNNQFWYITNEERPTRAVTTANFHRIDCAAGHVIAVHPKIGELSVKLPPRALNDFEWSWDADIFISQQALRILEENNVTGFETRSLKASYPNESRFEPPPLFELAVTGWGGMGEAAGVQLTSFCQSCRQRTYSIADPSRLVDPSAWDGSDLFMVWPLPRFRFASDRLAEIIRSNWISGVRLIPASQIPVKRGGGATPGALTTWMPERRALELGKTFDVL